MHITGDGLRTKCMPQLTRCPHCKRELKIPDGATGNLRCPLCKQVFKLRTAPAREPVAAAAGTGPAPKFVDVPPPVPPSTPNNKVSPLPIPRASGVRPPPPLECPSCKARLERGSTACLECGYVLREESVGLEAEESPNLCPNPACGVANPPGERLCQRCNGPLPYPPGTLLHGRYRLDKLLAIGGFAAVYLAADTRQGNRPVALKDMICGDPGEFLIRLNFFQREAQILRALANLPAVPRVYDIIQKGQSAQLVLEYISGQDLQKILDANGSKPFPFDQVVEWGKNICDVLSHLHALTPPVVHRDVKPENIMLLDDGRTIKMIDFGTARDVGRSQKTRLASKTRVYTEGYAPPEQILGKPEARSDLFALAGTMYHLLTGKSPEGFYTARELETQLAAANGAIPAGQRWLFELIKINLAEDVNDRYFSCREVKTDLERRQVTRQMQCPKCQTPNAVRLPFCCKCAEPLTDLASSCGHCGKYNRMGCRCCIYCGSRLR
jgi:Protein kinase domain